VKVMDREAARSRSIIRPSNACCRLNTHRQIEFWEQHGSHEERARERTQTATFGA
jgi:hypothetical protein